MIGDDIPMRADAAAPQLEQPAGYQRIRPEVINEFTTEFSALLKVVSERDLGPEHTRKLNELLDSFEVLMAEMEETRRALRAETLTSG